MGKVLFGMIFMAVVLGFAIALIVRADVDVNVSLPSVIVFSIPPEVVVIPKTNIYAVLDSEVDIFFYNGWWWRPWEGRWYRSHDYNSGWSYYQNVPVFYGSIPAGWRSDYREHRWQGQKWNYQRIPHQQVKSNWHSWEKSGYWEKQNAWGVQWFQSPTKSQGKQPVQVMQLQSGPK